MRGEAVDDRIALGDGSCVRAAPRSGIIIALLADDAISAAFRVHLEHLWPDRPHEEFAWTLGPINQTLPGFRVRRLSPTSPADSWIYVTIGAWQATKDNPHGNEFMLLSPCEDPRHVELLAMLANLHADRRYRICESETIEIGRPWLTGSTADHLLASLPLPFGPALERWDVDDRHIQVLWLVPITSSEARVASEHGADALATLLERSGVNVLSPSRRPVA
jgi:hypothetical protein